ncbi:MAG TPA: tyrosine-type recombinase/integrase [Solirubrobacteraceae bacterium]|nr:tyrosine-type recombinase/integrase [Solirubrobacteraceae bacterium]
MAANPVALAPDPEFGELIDDFLASQLSPRTRESYAGDLVIFLGWVAARGTHPREVARPDVDRYRNWLAEPIGPDGKPATNGRPRYAPATVARKLSAVRAFYNYLSERRVIPGSPAAGVKGPRLRREPRGRAITDDQVRRLLATATERGHETEAMVCLLVLNGLRVSEVCAADIEHLRREPGGGHSLVVRGKGGKEVEVALNERTERAVLQTIGARTQGPVFRRQDGRRLRSGSAAPRVPYNRQAVYRLLADLAGQAGIIGDEDGQVDGLSPHKLRHTFVTMLLDRGVPLVAVQDAARHSSSDTTRLYDRARAAWREHPTHKLDF